MDATFTALVNSTIAYLRGQPEGSASFDHIADHLTASIRVLGINDYSLDLFWHTPVVHDGTVYRILGQLQDASVVERVREGRGVVYALTDERKWSEPTW
jgi:hypothetical protein